MEQKEMAKIDGNIHVIPKDGESHDENAYCWCKPEWDQQNKKDYEIGLADAKVFVHRSREELKQ